MDTYAESDHKNAAKSSKDSDFPASSSLFSKNVSFSSYPIHFQTTPIPSQILFFANRSSLLSPTDPTRRPYTPLSPKFQVGSFQDVGRRANKVIGDNKLGLAEVF